MGRYDDEAVSHVFTNTTDTRENPLGHQEMQSAVDSRKPGDMVQSIVENGITEVPPEFVKPSHERVSRSQGLQSEGPHEQIPVIDLAMLDDEGGKRQVLADTARACEEWGCFQMISHGVPAPVMDAAMATAKRFFALPAAEKEEFRMTKVGGKGYGRTFDRPGVAKDWNDRLILSDYTLEGTESRGGTFFDLVLTNPPGAHEVLESYGEAVHELMRKMTTLLSAALGQAPEFLSSKFAARNATVLNHYPPCPQPDLVMGFSAHEDAGAFTFLQQGDVVGLEVLKDERWVSVPPLAHAFVVVVGDVLQVISNDRFKSVTHRAVAGPIARFVIANFIVTDDQTTIQPASELCSDLNPPAYRSLSYGDYKKMVISNSLYPNRLDALKLGAVLDQYAWL